MVRVQATRRVPDQPLPTRPRPKWCHGLRTQAGIAGQPEALSLLAMDLTLRTEGHT